MFGKEVYIKRRKDLINKIEKGVIVIFGNKECSMNYKSNFYPFRQDSSFLYLFGLDFPDLIGLIDVESGKEIIYGDDPTLDDIIWMGPQVSLSERCKTSGINEARSLSTFYSDIKEIIGKNRRVHYLPPYREQRRRQIEYYLNIKGGEADNGYSQELVSSLVDLRSIKSPVEIKEIESTMTNITHKMYLKVMEMAVPGNYEYAISGALESIGLENNCKMAFPVICTIHGEILHNTCQNNKLREGDLLLVDSGAESREHYATDITRTIPVGTMFSRMQKEIYSIVLKAQEESIKEIKPGITYKSIHLNAAKIIATGLKELGLMTGDTDDAVNRGAHSLFFPHGLGHMMGLDVHDMEDLGEDSVGYDEEIKRNRHFGLSNLRLGRRLQEGFVLTVEPGIYFIPELIKRWEAEKKFRDFINYGKLKTYMNFGGIRIEDDVLVTKDGCRVLGLPIPKHINEIEKSR
jgi:Xaa-Pro aminopeptidase